MRGCWSGFGMVTVGIHPTDFELNPTKIPPGGVVQNCPKKLELEFRVIFISPRVDFASINQHIRTELKQLEEFRFLFISPRVDFASIKGRVQNPQSRKVSVRGVPPPPSPPRP